MIVAKTYAVMLQDADPPVYHTAVDFNEAMSLATELAQYKGRAVEVRKYREFYGDDVVGELELTVWPLPEAAYHIPDVLALL
mgnify:CR=1 FL=1